MKLTRAQKQEILESAEPDSFATIQLKAWKYRADDGATDGQAVEEEGATVYHFSSQSFALDANGDVKPVTAEQESKYWLDAKGIRELREDPLCYDEATGQYKAEGVRDRLALPEYIRADCLVAARVIRTHDAVEARCGPARRITYARNDAGERFERTKNVKGGGVQIHPKPDFLARQSKPAWKAGAKSEMR